MQLIAGYSPIPQMCKDVALVIHLHNFSAGPHNRLTREVAREKMRAWQKENDPGASEEESIRIEKARGERDGRNKTPDMANGTAASVLAKQAHATPSEAAVRLPKSDAISSKSSAVSSRATPCTTCSSPFSGHPATSFKVRAMPFADCFRVVTLSKPLRDAKQGGSEWATITGSEWGEWAAPPQSERDATQQDDGRDDE
jgi:hypothetical protein